MADQQLNKCSEEFHFLRVVTLRHGYTNPTEADGGNDLDRSLTVAGKQQLQVLAYKLTQRGCTPTHTFVTSAKRTYETALELAPDVVPQVLGYGYPGIPEVDLCTAMGLAENYTDAISVYGTSNLSWKEQMSCKYVDILYAWLFVLQNHLCDVLGEMKEGDVPAFILHGPSGLAALSESDEVRSHRVAPGAGMIITFKVFPDKYMEQICYEFIS